MGKNCMQEIPQEELKRILGGVKMAEPKTLGRDADADLDACSEGCRDGCKDNCKNCTTGQTGGGDTILRKTYPLPKI